MLRGKQSFWIKSNFPNVGCLAEKYRYESAKNMHLLVQLCDIFQRKYKFVDESVMDLTYYKKGNRLADKVVFSGRYALQRFSSQNNLYNPLVSYRLIATFSARCYTPRFLCVSDL